MIFLVVVVYDEVDDPVRHEAVAAQVSAWNQPDLHVGLPDFLHFVVVLSPEVSSESEVAVRSAVGAGCRVQSIAVVTRVIVGHGRSGRDARLTLVRLMGAHGGDTLG
jgi:hypothetical protein